MNEPIPSKNVLWDTNHTISLIQECIQKNDAVLDVGCGAAWVPWMLGQKFFLSECMGIDIVDIRRIRDLPFQLYDGINIPLADNQFDLVLLNFVLHHVPNEKKPLLLKEAQRVSRRNVFVVEDTPRNAIDRYVSRRHGETFRKKIGSDASFGFYDRETWLKEFNALGFSVLKSSRIGRLARNWRQPYARSAFILGI